VLILHLTNFKNLKHSQPIFTILRAEASSYILYKYGMSDTTISHVIYKHWQWRTQIQLLCTTEYVLIF